MIPTLLAGVARRIISPPKGIYLIGYGDRTWGNRGINDNLTATALALQEDNCEVVIIACDLLAMNEITLARIKSEVNKNLVLCCSHTHSGPIVYADKRSSRKNKKYINFLVSQIIATIREATEKLQPAILAWGSGSSNIAVNRRERKDDGSIEIGINQEGVVDHSLGILQIQTPIGKPIANLVNFSCHNVVLGPKNLLVSSDWAGVMRSQVEDSTGVPCLFIQGATADLNPDHEWGDNDLEAVLELGHRVANSALTAMESLSMFSGVPIKFQESVIWLPLETKSMTAEPPDTYKSTLAKHVGLPKFLVDPILKVRYPWKTIVEDRNGFWSIPMAVVNFRLGELTWIGLGAEVFNEIGIAIKNQTTTNYSFFSSLTNGCIGYLPTDEEYPLGGYEIDLAPFFYRLPGRLRSDVARIVFDEIKELLNN